VFNSTLAVFQLYRCVNVSDDKLYIRHSDHVPMQVQIKTIFRDLALSVSLKDVSWLWVTSQVWTHKTSLRRPRYIEVFIRDRKVSGCVHVCTIFLLDIGTGPTVLHFLFFIFSSLRN